MRHEARAAVEDDYCEINPFASNADSASSL